MHRIAATVTLPPAQSQRRAGGIVIRNCLARPPVWPTLRSISMTSPAQPKGLPAAQAAKVAEFVGYQAGAVVSREVVRKPAGNVTLFAFDEGEGLSEHTAPFDALVQVLEGEAEITISGRTQRLQGGMMILLPAGQPHALKGITRFKMMLTMIRSQTDFTLPGRFPAVGPV